MDEKYDLPSVEFGSGLVRDAFEIERLRGNLGSGTTPARTLGELHALFHVVMSVISARIEGNRTTVYDAFAELPTREEQPDSESIREITNVLNAIEFIDSTDAREPITHVFIRELHRIAVDGLDHEGDRTPGEYRTSEVSIGNSMHAPPSHVYVHAEMADLLAFANRNSPTHEQMLQAAIAHHRFVWIHPFGNGNGRVSRLFTYAMLRRSGFDSIPGYRAVDPLAVFGNDRDGYYAALEAADDLSSAGTIAWCEFFVHGLREDLNRLVRLQDFDFTTKELLDPAIDRLVASGGASAVEGAALKIAVRRETVKAADLAAALAGTPSQRSVAIRSMVERGLLTQDTRGPRFYRAPFARAPLAQFIVRQLDAIGYLPRMLQHGG